MTFEEMLARLDEIIALLGSGNTTLEQSLTLYAEGTRLLSDCSGKLETARVKIETLLPQEAKK